MAHKTQYSVEEKNIGEKFRKGETKRSRQDEQNKTLTAREGRAGELGEYVWFVWKLVWFDLLSLTEARWLKQFLKIAFTRFKMV